MAITWVLHAVDTRKHAGNGHKTLPNQLTSLSPIPFHEITLVSIPDIAQKTPLLEKKRLPVTAHLPV